MTRGHDDLYRTIFENTGTAMIVIEEDTTISLCNEAFVALSGYPRDEIEGRKSWTEFVAPEDLPRMLGYHRRRREDPAAAPHNYEFLFVDRHGRKHPIWATVALVPGTRRSVASFLDITDLRRAKEALAASEANYRTIFEAASDAIFIHDPETGAILDVNQKMCAMYELSREEALSLTIADLSAGEPPYDREHALAWFRKAAAAPQLFEWLAQDRHGRRFWVEVNLKHVVIGGKVRVLAVVRDITRRKEAALALYEERERYRVTLASIGDAVICTDDKGMVTFCNPVAADLTGWPEKEALGRPLAEVFRIVGEFTGQPVDNPVHRVLREGVVVGLGNHTVLIGRDGRKIPIMDTAAPIRGENGEILGVVVVFRDDTERRRAERERRENLARLRRSLESAITAVATLVEMRDPYTAGHQRRVAELACAIAREMGLPEERVAGLRFAALIHDVGKTVIPAAILNKPGHLTEIEFALIKTHPEVGYDVLKNIDFPWPVARIVLQHHERMNGSGYPAGLKGEAILLEARILAVADVLEAMASHRPYRPAHDTKEALAEIARHRGELYDPDVVDAAISLFTTKGFSFDRSQ